MVGVQSTRVGKKRLSQSLAQGKPVDLAGQLPRETFQLQITMDFSRLKHLVLTQDLRRTVLFSELVHLCKYQHLMTLVQRGLDVSQYVLMRHNRLRFSS